MAYPHPALIEIAAGRPGGVVADQATFVESALEHRMAGLAFEAAHGGDVEIDSAARRALAGAKLAGAAHNARVEAAAAGLVKRMRDQGWDGAVFKGIATAKRWYPEPGTRPTADVDLLLSPGTSNQIDEVLAHFAPTHGLAGKAQRLFDAGRIQSIDFEWDDVWIDVHTDPIKVGIDLPGIAAMWGRLDKIELAGVEVSVLDSEATLLQAAVHLQKDRFSRLHGFADIARIAAAGLDWEWVQGFADELGLRIHFNEALRVVSDVLAVDLPYDRSVKSRLWRAIWSERTRLRGDVGLTRKVRTHYWIPMTMPGRRADAVRWWSRIVIPPGDIVDYMHPDTSGPYPLRVLQYRSRLARERHQRNRDQRRDGAL
ncbi:MAG: hypothetical protein HKN91_07700 [Acidimicrobiia bacterium]|nr:hypothetical protein [Acidimicrobiia bacterium]